MVVEPESLCWVTGRMVKARDGVTWAEEFARLPALEAVVRDDGTGLGKGVKLERARRRAQGLPDLDDTLDVFHTLREGGRALRRTSGAATRALERADAAQKEFDDRARQGQSRQGHGAPLNRLWRQAERTWDQAQRGDFLSEGGQARTVSALDAEAVGGAEILLWQRLASTSRADLAAQSVRAVHRSWHRQ